MGAWTVPGVLAGSWEPSPHAGLPCPILNTGGGA